MSNLQLFKTKKGPGILAKMQNGTRPQLHDRLCALAQDFFEQRNLIFVPREPLNPETFRWEVFADFGDVHFEYERDDNGGVIGQITVEDLPPREHSLVTGIYRAPQTSSRPLVPDANYPVSWSTQRAEICSLHFIPRGPGVRELSRIAFEQKGIEYRDAFYDAALRRVG